MLTQIAETAGQLNCCELKATTDGILIIHDWVVVEHESITCVPETPPAAMANQDENIKQLSSDDEHSSGSETEGYEAESQTDSCSGDEGEGDSLATLYSPTHTLTFKVMGTTKIHGIQDILLAARDLLDSGGSVPVELVPDPDNPKDNRAIAFQCLINDKWHIFGYVSEVLDEVHTAITLHEIINITFKKKGSSMFSCGQSVTMAFMLQ